ncbi:hypothetical protein CRYUN_Cryun29cG0048200 [Craigia yunnanensis]
MGTGAGAIVPVGEDLLGAAAYHLVVVAATAGLHIVILIVIDLMLMEIKVGLELKQILNGKAEVKAKMSPKAAEPSRFRDAMLEEFCSLPYILA